MTIAEIITRADSLGGSHSHLLDLAEALLAEGHSVTVLVGGSGPVIAELQKRRVPYRALPHLAKPIHPVRDLLAIFEIWKALRDLRPQIVATHTAKAGLLGRCAAAMARIPAVYTPHGWAITDRVSARQGRLFRSFERLGGSLSARIINVCEYERSLALRHEIAPAKKLAIVHNGIADVPAEFVADPGRQPPRLIAVARFEEPKDHRTLLHALALLRDYPWTLDLVGDGPLEVEIRRMAAELGLEKRLRFLGVRRDIASLLARAQLFVLSTRSEAFPYSVLEAMRAGLPIAASDAGGIGEAAVNGHTALLSPVRDVTALQHNLRQLIIDPSLRRQMGYMARCRFLAQFTLDKMLMKTFEIYENVIAQRQVTPVCPDRDREVEAIREFVTSSPKLSRQPSLQTISKTQA